MDNKYQRGKIYKLVSSETDKIYVGSTIQKLKKRKSEHKTKPNKSSKLICCYDNFNIVLIKNYPCNSKKELEREEGYIIKQNLDICVNEKIAGRTKKEYNESRRDITNEYRRNKKWYCECCKITINRCSKKRHEGIEKHQSNSARYNLI